MTLLHITGAALILVPLAFNAIFFALGRSFEYPDILRRPTGYILERFAAGGPRLIALWYAFAFTALLAVPMSLLLSAAFSTAQPLLAAVAGLLGTLSGLVQALGLLRWPFVVPGLAAAHESADASPALRETAEVVFQAFHQYAGVAVGEHLGYLFTASWTIVVSAMMFDSVQFSPLVGLLGVTSAVGILTGLLEPAGWKPASALNAISYIIWSVWLILTGLTLLFALSPL